MLALIVFIGVAVACGAVIYIRKGVSAPAPVFGGITIFVLLSAIVVQGGSVPPSSVLY